MFVRFPLVFIAFSPARKAIIFVCLLTTCSAGAGFEPAVFRSWAWRVGHLLHPAIDLSRRRGWLPINYASRPDLRTWLTLRGQTLQRRGVVPGKVVVLIARTEGMAINNNRYEKNTNNTTTALVLISCLRNRNCHFKLCYKRNTDLVGRIAGGEGLASP